MARIYVNRQERIRANVEPLTESGCWIWMRHLDRLGYGQMNFKRDGVNVSDKAHRVAFEAFVGPIPEGFEVDHVKARGCASRSCVNPDHLEAVTHQVNVLRGSSPIAVAATRTHCLRAGHPLGGDNLYPGDVKNGRARRCRACNRERQRRPAEVGA